MIKAAIIGATGFTGSELIRILLRHPKVELTSVTSSSQKGVALADVHPQYYKLSDLIFSDADEMDEREVDVCFLALPHRISMEYIEKWKNKPFHMVDLSGDYRLSDADVYETWYDKKHVTPDLVPKVPYGLPEINREQIKGAKIVANPGCYPTASILGLAPLATTNMIDLKSIVVDAKSGLTGAGVKSKPGTHFSQVNDNFKAYGLKNHRHTIEIEEAMEKLGKHESRIQFTPHLLPVDRGILATIYATPSKTVTEKSVKRAFENYYKDETFIRIRSEVPQLKHVRGTNFCDIYATYDERTNRIIVLSAIDNLVKGAAGAAVQNMNILFQLDEETGLKSIPLQP